MERQQEQLAFQEYYNTVQRTASYVREGITKYAVERDILDALMLPGITYRNYVKILEESHSKCLSDELLANMLAEKYSAPILQQLK